MEDIFLGEGVELDGTTLGAFVHTTHKALEELYQFAGVSPSSCVIDIGCGDGRAAIVAAEKFRCHAVGGIDVGLDLIQKFDSKVRDALQRMSSKCETSILPKCFCVHGDALAWGHQEKMFLSDDELAGVAPATVVFASDVSSELVSSRRDVLLPKPTHIYLYILQHMLRHLVPLLKRIRQEVPGVVILSAFEFKQRPADPQDDDGQEYLDVPVAAMFEESKGRLTFRVYK